MQELKALRLRPLRAGVLLTVSIGRDGSGRRPEALGTCGRAIGDPLTGLLSPRPTVGIKWGMSTISTAINLHHRCAALGH